MSYFNDLWTLTSPSALMKGTWNVGMAMPLSVAKVAYNIFQQTSANPDLTPPHELDPFIKPIWAQGYLATQDPLDPVFPFDEAIIEALTGPDKPWDDLHHKSYFLP